MNESSSAIHDLVMPPRVAFTGAPLSHAAPPPTFNSPAEELLSIVIPAFNEADRIEPTLRQALEQMTEARRPAEVIVVDDGSGDATSVVVARVAADDRRVRLVRLPANRGKGYAVRTGVANASGARILFADADGSTPITELARLDRAIDDGADVAIGSRAGRAADVTVEARLYRRVAGRLFHQVVRYAGVSGIVDTQCGFKLFTAAAAAELFPRVRLCGYAFDVELLMIAQRRGLRVDEVPVNWSHQSGSKVHLLRDGMRMARDVIRMRSYAVRGVYGRRQVAAPVTNASAP